MPGAPPPPPRCMLEAAGQEEYAVDTITQDKAFYTS